MISNASDLLAAAKGAAQQARWVRLTVARWMLFLNRMNIPILWCMDYPMDSQTAWSDIGRLEAIFGCEEFQSVGKMVAE